MITPFAFWSGGFLEPHTGIVARILGGSLLRKQYNVCTFLQKLNLLRASRKVNCFIQNKMLLASWLSKFMAFTQKTAYAETS